MAVVGVEDPACSPLVAFWGPPSGGVESDRIGPDTLGPQWWTVGLRGGLRVSASARWSSHTGTPPWRLQSTTICQLPYRFSHRVAWWSSCQCLGRANSYQNGNRLQRFASCQALRGRLSTRPVNVHAIACRRHMYPIARMKSTRIPKAHMLTRSHAEPDATGGGLFGGVPAAAGGLAAAFAGAPAAAGRTPAPGFPVFGAPRV